MLTQEEIAELLPRWEQFLRERLGGTDLTAEELMAEGIPDEMIAEVRKHMADDPEGWRATMVSPQRIRTMSDEEMIASQEAILGAYGFALPIPDQLVIMRELLPLIRPEASLLDVGWRPCFYPAFLQSQGLIKAHTVGVTPSEGAVRRLLEIIDKDKVFMELRHGSPFELPFADGEFGQVISIDLLHWLHGWRRAIAEIARVAAEGARIFIVLVSYSARNGEIDTFAVVETLAKNGVDVQRFDTFSAEKTRSPRLFVTGVKEKETKGKPRTRSTILIPGKTDY